MPSKKPCCFSGITSYPDNVILKMMAAIFDSHKESLSEHKTNQAEQRASKICK